MDKERMFTEMSNNMKENPNKDDQQVTPAKAFLSTTLNNFTSFALFFVQYESLIQLSQGKSVFNDSFLWIPSLSGPNGIDIYGFQAILDLPTSLPFFIAPLWLMLSQVLG